MTAGVEYRVVAFNRAENHSNRVHSTEFARSVGFRAGLVPGVDVFAYLAHAVCEAWGLDWLQGGGLEARFARPVYGGDQLTVRAEAAGVGLALQVVDASGEVCATGSAERDLAEPGPDPDQWPVRPLPHPPPPATRAALEAMPALGGIEETFTAESAREQLAEVRETLEDFSERRIVHPGHLLRLTDSILAANVELPPWMHVSSRARFFAPVHWEDTVTARARLASLFERKGHHFVQLDVLALRGDQPVMRVDPYTAIYRPAFV